MLLADSAQSIEGKLYVLGGGWSTTGPAPAPSAIALKIDVPWDEANRAHPMRLELLTSDGKPVEMPGPQGLAPVLIEARLEVGRPPGITAGVPLDATFAVNISPMPLVGGRYEWRCSLPEADISSACAFTVRPQPPQQQFRISGLPPQPPR
jgi:hypothetical protein